MKTHRLVKRIWLPKARAVFDFFANPRNLDQLTPPWLSFRVLSPESTVVGAGTLLDYRLRLRGIPLRWQSAIEIWEPPRRFVDRQTKGPYVLWLHEHTFANED